MSSEFPPDGIALHQLGFRPFFLCGSVFAVVSVALWLSITGFATSPIAITALPPVIWHAHEMIYGYAFAVIAGFLLTAVRNWTGAQTLRGAPLMLLVLVWLLARFMPFVPHSLALLAMAVLDLSFNIALCLAVLHPIVKARQRKPMGVWLKLVLLTLGNLLFYLGLLNLLGNGVQLGLYAGLYLIISLILIISRRVLPMFIENGVGYAVSLTNRRWIDISTLVLMLVFIIAEVFLRLSVIAGLSAGLLFLLHAVRMAGWHTVGIWKKPLLWILYVAYGWIVFGFAMTAASHAFGLDPRLAVHAFAYGGIGLMTLGMMARVALGHTGRDIARPPAILLWVFSAMLLGGIARVAMPIVAPDGLPIWIASSQVLWIFAFTLFAWVYAPMLVRPRIDGRSG